MGFYKLTNLTLVYKRKEMKTSISINQNFKWFEELLPTFIQNFVLQFDKIGVVNTSYYLIINVHVYVNGTRINNNSCVKGKTGRDKIITIR